MDFLDYSDKTFGTHFPTVTASPSSPKTLYHAHSEITYVNTGSGWQAAVQHTTGSVYSAFSSASSSTQAAIVTSMQNTSSAPHAAHTTVATKASEVAVRGR